MCRFEAEATGHVAADFYQNTRVHDLAGKP